jgi:hypothetical protein
VEGLLGLMMASSSMEALNTFVTTTNKEQAMQQSVSQSTRDDYLLLILRLGAQALIALPVFLMLTKMVFLSYSCQVT